MPTGGFGKFCHFWVYRRSHTCAGLYAYTEKSWGNYNEKISEIKSHLFENINKIDKPLARMMKKKNNQIAEIKNQRIDSTDLIEIKRILREFYEQYYANKLNNFDA